MLYCCCRCFASSKGASTVCLGEKLILWSALCWDYVSLSRAVVFHSSSRIKRNTILLRTGRGSWNKKNKGWRQYRRIDRAERKWSRSRSRIGFRIRVGIRFTFTSRLRLRFRIRLGKETINFTLSIAIAAALAATSADASRFYLIAPDNPIGGFLVLSLRLSVCLLVLLHCLARRSSFCLKFSSKSCKLFRKYTWLEAQCVTLATIWLDLRRVVSVSAEIETNTNKLLRFS